MVSFNYQVEKERRSKTQTIGYKTVKNQSSVTTFLSFLTKGYLTQKKTEQDFPQLHLSCLKSVVGRMDAL